MVDEQSKALQFCLMALPRCSAEDRAAPTAREPTIYVGRALISGVDQDKAATVVSAATTSSANR